MIGKTSRQLIIFHILLYSKIVELVELTNLIPVSAKTISRDMKELQEAGLIRVIFSKGEGGYVHMDDERHCPFSPPVYSNNKAKDRHIDRLLRLATIMIELKGHVEYPFYDERSLRQETCSTWYKKKFPNLSTRTMQRDFEELNRIGYFIEYNREDQYYEVDFPDGIEGIQSRMEYLNKRNRGRMMGDE